MSTERFAMSVAAAAEATGLSGYRIADLCRRGVIRARKVGAQWSIEPADLRAWYESLPTNQDEGATR